jgi:hypothetical protein
VIGRVLKRGKRVYGLLRYLYSPGKTCVHSNPHLVSGWRHPADLEPPLREDGKRDFSRLTALLEQPLALLDDQAPAKPVWHCTFRAAPGDPDLGDGAWMRIAAEIMDRTGLSQYGEEGQGVRWVAVHHGHHHIHIAATLARQDGRPARLHNDYWRIGEALRDLEAEYGLQPVVRADRTAARRPTRAETELAGRAGRPEPNRVTLARHVQAAAAGARSAQEFFSALAARGVLVRLRRSDKDLGQVTGYAAGLPGHRNAAGGQVWFGGGKLAPDLTLPKLRARWPASAPGPGRGRPDAARSGPVRPLDGTGMTDVAARAALRHQAARCAAASRSETGFCTGLRAAGLLVRVRPGPHSRRPAGYAVTLPGLTGHLDGTPAWYGGGTVFTGSSWLHPTKSNWPHHVGSSFFWPHLAGARTSCNLRGRAPFVAAKGRATWGRNCFANDLGGAGRTWNGGAGTGSRNHGTLDPALALGVLRRRWQAGRPGLPPAAALLDHAATTAIYRHAAAVADNAARQLRGAPPGQAADIAWAAADVLYAAADATGNRDLRMAADGFGRAARAPWGRIPAPTPPGNVLRTAAYLMTATTPGATRRLTRHALTRALADLAAELARLRHAQQRLRQATAARDAAATLTAASRTPALDADCLAPPIPQAAARIQPAARRRPTARPPAPGRSR